MPQNTPGSSRRRCAAHAGAQAKHREEHPFQRRLRHGTARFCAKKCAKSLHAHAPSFRLGGESLPRTKARRDSVPRSVFDAGD